MKKYIYKLLVSIQLDRCSRSFIKFLHISYNVTKLKKNMINLILFNLQRLVKWSEKIQHCQFGISIQKNIQRSVYHRTCSRLDTTGHKPRFRKRNKFDSTGFAARAQRSGPGADGQPSVHLHLSNSQWSLPSPTAAVANLLLRCHASTVSNTFQNSCLSLSHGWVKTW